MHASCRTSMALLLCLFGVATTLRAELPALAVQEIFPPVFSTLKPNTVAITSGRSTQDIAQILFSHPGIHAVLDSAPALPMDDVPQSNWGHFQVTVDATVPEGYYEAWCVGRYGISNPRTIAVVHRPVEVLSPDTPPFPVDSLSSGKVYVKRMNTNAIWNFELDSMVGLPESPNPHIVVLTHSLNSLLIPSVRAYADGKVILQKRGTSEPYLKLSRDDYLHFDPSVPPLFRLSDFLHRGGDGYAAVVLVNPDANDPLLQVAESNLGAIVRYGLTDWPRLQAPVGESTTGTVILPSPPWEATVQIPAKSDRGTLEFPVAANSEIELEVFSHALGQSTDMRAVVERNTGEANAKWELVQIHEDGPTLGGRGIRWSSRDPIAAVPKMDKDSRMRVTLIDLQHNPSRSGERSILVRLGPPQPRFHAIAHWDPDINPGPQARITGACLRRGGQIGIHVVVRRAGGFTGPVKVRASGLPSGVVAAEALLAEGQSETELILESDESAPAWSGPIALTAHAILEGLEVTRPVTACTIATSASSDRGAPVAIPTSQLMLHVLEQEVAPIQIRTAASGVLEVHQGASITIPIRAVRRAGGDAKCILRPQNVPAKVALGELELPANAVEANPECKVAADAPPGEYSVWFLTEMTVKYALHPELHARTVAYRDRLQSRWDDPSWKGDRPSLEKALADAKARVDATAKEVAPRDVPTFFSAGEFRLRILPPPKESK